MEEETDVCLIDNFPLSAARNHAAAAAVVVVPLVLDLVQVRAQRPGSNLGLVEQEPKARLSLSLNLTTADIKNITF